MYTHTYAHTHTHTRTHARTHAHTHTHRGMSHDILRDTRTQLHFDYVCLMALVLSKFSVGNKFSNDRYTALSYIEYIISVDDTYQCNILHVGVSLFYEACYMQWFISCRLTSNSVSLSANSLLLIEASSLQ